MEVGQGTNFFKKRQILGRRFRGKTGEQIYHPALPMLYGIQLFSFERLPGRLTMGDAGTLLGFKEHDMGVLIAAKKLKPLGSPVPNAPKLFATSDIIRLSQDLNWLDQATRVVTKHWSAKNSNKMKVNARTNT